METTVSARAHGIPDRGDGEDSRPAGAVVRAFGVAHVERLTGLSRRQLEAWDRRGFFTPSYGTEDRRQPYSRIYSFIDVVGLKAIAVLMKQYRVPLRQLIRVAEELSKRGYENWADVRLHVVNRQVHFQHPGTETVEGLFDEQYAMLPVIDVIRQVGEDVDMLRQRKTDEFGRIERHRHLLHNAAIFAGTRIPVSTVQEFDDAGYSDDEILAEYPSLTIQDIRAARNYKKGLERRD